MRKERKYFSDKLFDCHTHCSGIDFYNYLKGRFLTTQDIIVLEEYLNANSIDYAITFPFPTTIYYDIYSFLDGYRYKPSGLCKFPFEIENKYLLNQISHFKCKKILPFLCFSLNANLLEQIYSLEKLVDENYVYGLKYHTHHDQHNPMDIMGKFELLSFINKNDIPLLIHCGNDDLTSATHVYELAKNLPDIRICVAHLGENSGESVPPVSANRATCYQKLKLRICAQR